MPTPRKPKPTPLHPTATNPPPYTPPQNGAPSTINNPCRPQCNLPPGTTIAQAIIHAIAHLNTTETQAAHWAGTTPNTLTQWKKHGQTPNKPHHTTHTWLTNTLKTAHTDAQIEALAAWKGQFGRDWKAARAWLAVAEPVVYGDSVVVGGVGVGLGGGVLSLEECEELLGGVERGLGSGVVGVEVWDVVARELG